MYRLNFGKHKGKTITQVPFGYALWLAGKRVHECRDQPVINRLEDFVDNVWMNRDATCGCEEGKAHGAHCYYICLGVTRDQTRDKVIKLIYADIPTFKAATYLKAWIWVFVNHKPAVEAARKYIENANKCFHCHKPLVPIGNGRTNGACHDDWQKRRFHKKCWIKFSD